VRRSHLRDALCSWRYAVLDTRIIPGQGAFPSELEPHSTKRLGASRLSTGTHLLNLPQPWLPTSPDSGQEGGRPLAGSAARFAAGRRSGGWSERADACRWDSVGQWGGAQARDHREAQDRAGDRRALQRGGVALNSTGALRGCGCLRPLPDQDSCVRRPYICHARTSRWPPAGAGAGRRGRPAPCPCRDPARDRRAVRLLRHAGAGRGPWPGRIDRSSLLRSAGGAGVAGAGLADVGVGAGLGDEVARAASVCDAGLEHLGVQPLNPVGNGRGAGGAIGRSLLTCRTSPDTPTPARPAATTAPAAHSTATPPPSLRSSGGTQ